MLPPLSIGLITTTHLVVVLATFTWLPSQAGAVFAISLLVVFVRLTWLFGVWNPTLSGWRRLVVMLFGGLVSTAAIGFVTVAILFDYLPWLGYRE